MKIVFPFILFVVFSVLAYSQQTFQDVVYLKNGGILRGRILEKFPDQSIKFENSDSYKTVLFLRRK